MTSTSDTQPVQPVQPVPVQYIVAWWDPVETYSPLTNWLNTMGQTGWVLVDVRESRFIFMRKGVMPSPAPTPAPS